MIGMNFFFNKPVLGSNEKSSLNIFLIVLARVKTLLLIAITNADGNNEIDEFENEEGSGKAVAYCNGHGFYLCDEEGRIAICPAISTQGVHSFCGEDAGHQHTYDTTNSMAGKYIERIIKRRP